jgi:hypothetical protein
MSVIVMATAIGERLLSRTALQRLLKLGKRLLRAGEIAGLQVLREDLEIEDERGFRWWYPGGAG